MLVAAGHGDVRGSEEWPELRELVLERPAGGGRVCQVFSTTAAEPMVLWRSWTARRDALSPTGAAPEGWLLSSRVPLSGGAASPLLSQQQDH